jgi:2-succinyl-5-enolpyruvyl-6-hydroxy-3-cyclohexene-1-carboxylate synthase
VNGIDGTISHAAGIAAASGRPTLLVTGDLAFCHDMSGLAAAVTSAPNLDILLLNNNGGGIFHFLPVHRQEDAAMFERLHGTPQNLNLAALKDVYGLDWQVVQDPRELAALADGPRKRPRIFEVRISREANHRAYTGLMTELGKEAVRI